MIKKTMQFITALFFFSMLSFHCVVVQAYAEAGIQINTHAIDSDGSFLADTVVDFIITDPEGLRVGYDPRSKHSFEEFDAGYGSEGIDEFYHNVAFFPPEDGTYTIDVIGDELKAFHMSIAISREGSGGGMPIYSVKGVVDEGLVSRFELSYSSDSDWPSGTVVRVATASSLIQDIKLSRKAGWIDNNGVMKRLLKKAKAAEASIKKGNNKAATKQLEAIKKEIYAQAAKHLNNDAAMMLLEDVQQLIDSM